MAPIKPQNQGLASRIRLWLTGIGAYYILSWLYDYVVISFCLIYFGLWWGTAITLILSVFLDLGTLMFYDWYKKDWLAIETLKDISSQKGILARIFRFSRDKGTVITVGVLSLVGNAFLVTAYMRKEAHSYNGLAMRDWAIFLSSSLITNLYWVFLIGGGIEALKFSKDLILNF